MIYLIATVHQTPGKFKVTESELKTSMAYFRSCKSLSIFERKMIVDDRFLRQLTHQRKSFLMVSKWGPWILTIHEDVRGPVGETVPMKEITVQRAKVIASRKKLKPSRVKGTNGVQLTKGRNPRLEIISWDEFEATLKKRQLSIYESNGWLKIMRKKRI